MRSTFKVMIVIGVLLALAGVVVSFQGLGVVGPQSSFMYNSQTWVLQGAGIAVIGVLTLLAGILLGGRARTAG